MNITSKPANPQGSKTKCCANCGRPLKAQFQLGDKCHNVEACKRRSERNKWRQEWEGRRKPVTNSLEFLDFKSGPFTDGPWQVVNHEGAFSEIYIEPESGWNLGEFPIAKLEADNETTDTERKTIVANAYLIASAPELAVALVDLVEIICGDDRDVTIEDCDTAKRVLIKALNLKS